MNRIYNRRISKDIWYDGCGDKMKKGSYSENEIKYGNDNCVHNCEKKIVEVFYFAGAHYRKMRKCKKCNGYVSADMINHPRGRHEFTVRAENGIKCKYCEIVLLGGPLMIFQTPMFN
jgi:aspartate carbamoyltransferase regulatory subunit